jgi:UDP-N-acetylglucosamine 2-epimerase (non-hydrolysing)
MKSKVQGPSPRVVPKRVLVVFGTRPEAIKLAPVITELKRRPRKFRLTVAVTAQHRHMLDQVLAVFDIRPDFDLDVMRPGQTPSAVLSRVVEGIDRVLAKTRPDIVMVQGDTTSALAAALAAYHRRVAVGHVEAGLRTGDKYAPFPEEMNRRLISAVADVHFAPTAQARANLLAEGVPSRNVHVTGNTVIDALLAALASNKPWRAPIVDRLLKSKVHGPESKVILVTAHRRESFGPGVERICRALARIVRANPDVEVIYPVHLNPNVRKPVTKLLSGQDRIHLIEPLEYLEFCRLMKASYLILTDSGGIQEEAPALGKPVLVLRDKTERPEAIEAGTARLVGTDPATVVVQAGRLLRSRAAYRRMAEAKNPFGDGRAAQRIVRIIGSTFGRRP